MSIITNNPHSELEKEKLLNYFYQEVLACAPSQTLMDICSSFFQNPILLLNEYFVPVVSSGFLDGELPENSFFTFLENVPNLAAKNSAQVLEPDSSFLKIILEEFTCASKNDIYYFCILEASTPLDLTQDCAYTEQICRALSRIT